MGISIKHDVYERAIRDLAAERGVSLTDAIGMAVLDDLARRIKERQVEDFMTRVRKVQALIAAAPVLDPRPYDELLYDEDGLPI